MLAVEFARLARLKNSDTFLTAHPLSSPTPEMVSTMARLASAIQAGQDNSVVFADRTDALRRCTQRSKVLRKQLHTTHLVPLARSAKALSADVPGIMAHFTVPNLTLRERAYITAAETRRDRAREFATAFRSFGAPADFITTMSAAISQVASIAAQREQLQQERKSARQRYRDALAIGGQAIVQLDAIVRRVYASDPSILTAWTHAMSLGGRKKKKSPAPETTEGTAPKA